MLRVAEPWSCAGRLQSLLLRRLSWTCSCETCPGWRWGWMTSRGPLQPLAVCGSVGARAQQLLLSPQMVSKLPLMKTICNLHLDKLEFFRLLHPETAMNFPPLYKEVFNSELQYSDPRES